MVAGADHDGEGLRLGEDALAATGAHFDAVGSGCAEHPVAVHVRGLGRVDRPVARGRVEVDARAGSEGAALEECDASALGGLGQVQGQVRALGQGGVVDAFGGQAGPHDVAVLRFGQHVGGGAHRAEHVVARVRQGGRAHEARVGADGQGRGGQGAQHGGARVGERVVLDGQPVGGAVLAGRLGEAHIQVSAADLDGVGQQ